MIAAERARVLEIRSAGQAASSQSSLRCCPCWMSRNRCSPARRADRASLRNEYTRSRARLGRRVRRPGCLSRCRDGLRARLPRAASRRATGGWRCGSVWPAATSPAVTRRPCQHATRPLPGLDASGHGVGRAGRGLALVLRAPPDRIVLTRRPLGISRPSNECEDLAQHTLVTQDLAVAQLVCGHQTGIRESLNEAYGVGVRRLSVTGVVYDQGRHGLAVGGLDFVRRTRPSGCPTKASRCRSNARRVRLTEPERLLELVEQGLGLDHRSEQHQALGPSQPKRSAR